ncbi:MAG: hypothetical protein J6W81_05735 [Lentisphaeria bacterium]|nr:hypothetical protein [Lentisphaeria bacterium]
MKKNSQPARKINNGYVFVMTTVPKQLLARDPAGKTVIYTEQYGWGRE